MTDYFSRAGLILLSMAIVILSVAYVKNLREPVIKLVPVQDPNYIPSPRDIQQRLKDLDDPRYDPGKIDGIIGIDTRSQIAWDNLIKDRYAKKSFEISK